jgi:hypothetical protein
MVLSLLASPALLRLRFRLRREEADDDVVILFVGSSLLFSAVVLVLVLVLVLASSSALALTFLSCVLSPLLISSTRMFFPFVDALRSNSLLVLGVAVSFSLLLAVAFNSFVFCF